MVTSKLLVLLAAFASSYLPLLIEGSSCNNQCSAEELNHFWDDCCCIKCSDGEYTSLPNGVSSDASLPWWTCCDAVNSYCMFLTLVPIVMSLVGMFFWYIFYGYVIFPTSIVELSKYSNNNKEGNPKLECGPRDRLSGWRVVMKASLRSTAIHQREEQNDQHSGGAGFVGYEYLASIDFSNERGESFRDVDVHLKSYHAYKQLDDYLRARQGICYAIATTDTSHPTNGYELITFGPDYNELFLYRPHKGHFSWKFFLFLQIVFPFLGGFMVRGCDAAPNLCTVRIIISTNVLLLLLTWACFYHFFGHNNTIGASGVFVQESNRYKSGDRPNIDMENEKYFVVVKFCTIVLFILSLANFIT